MHSCSRVMVDAHSEKSWCGWSAQRPLWCALRVQDGRADTGTLTDSLGFVRRLLVSKAKNQRVAVFL